MIGVLHLDNLIATQSTLLKLIWSNAYSQSTQLTCYIHVIMFMIIN